MKNEEIRKIIGDPALYEGLAEEATELAHAALKVARILRGENPTPASLEKAQKSLAAEYSDLEIYLELLEVFSDLPVYFAKRERMIARIQEAMK